MRDLLNSVNSFVGIEVLTSDQDEISYPIQFRVSEERRLKSSGFEISDRVQDSVFVRVVVTTDLWRGLGSFQVYQTVKYTVPVGVMMEGMELEEVEVEEEGMVGYVPVFQLSNGKVLNVMSV